MAPRTWHIGAVIGALAMVGSGVIDELWFAPLRPGGSMLVFKVIPFAFALPGIFRANLYTLQWASILSLVYLALSLVQWASGHGTAVWSGALESAATLVFFVSALLYVAPFKRAAKARRDASENSHDA